MALDGCLLRSGKELNSFPLCTATRTDTPWNRVMEPPSTPYSNQGRTHADEGERWVDLRECSLKLSHGSTFDEAGAGVNAGEGMLSPLCNLYWLIQ